MLLAGTTSKDLLNGTNSIWIDRVSFGTIGVLGLILLTVSFGSQHEPLHQNWNLLWALPTHVVAAAGFKRWQNVVWFRYYLLAALLLDTALLMGWFLIPQQLPATVLPLILALIVRLSFWLFKDRING